jgi:DGQHR domain-containing protein
LPSSAQDVFGILLQSAPAVYLTALPGKWLLAHSTPSWRLANPHKGFQRIVKKDRAKEIARTVLDKGRTFPNALTLATDVPEFDFSDNRLKIPAKTKLLVVDGQHRLWAQNFSKVEGTYPCVIHMARHVKDMAQLFLEINDNQRRVPSSLRWDLVRLVRSEDRSIAMTADIVYELATRKGSPFYTVGIDLTGEKRDVAIKQGSLAPEIKSLLARDFKKHPDADVEQYTQLLVNFFTAIRSLDSDGWETASSPYFKARVLRAMIRVLSDLLAQARGPEALTAIGLRHKFEHIDPATLSDEAVRKVQGSAGVHDLYQQIRKQVLGSEASR